MDRRELLKIATSSLFGVALTPILGYCENSTPTRYGWNPDYKSIKQFIIRRNIQCLQDKTSKSFKGSGEGRAVFLYKYLEKAVGEIIPHNQMLGDCVSHSYGLAIDLLATTQIYGLGLKEKFIAKASTEVLYAGSRYEIGYLKYGNSALLRGGGTLGSYTAEFISDYGMLPRGVYGDIDLMEYNPKIARLWESKGIPDFLEPRIKKHPIHSYALVLSYEDVRDAIVNGYPVVLCSSIGFNPNCRRHNKNGRDEMGFLHRCGIWYHSLCVLGVDDTVRPGVLLMNSWGSNWVKGNKRHGQPEGSFWVDADTIDLMCSRGDSYAISGFFGFPSKKLDYNLF